MGVDYYLLSAARRAHRLRAERTYVLGRDEACDIVLQDALASRRHAEVKWSGDDSWTVVDLASRNGVMVNGQRIVQNMRLDDGAQLQIGGQVYRMYALPPGGDPGSLGSQAPQISTVETMGAGMNLQELANQGATFTGVVQGGLLDLLQFFQITRKSGRLDFTGGPVLASVWLQGGTAVHACHGQISGFDGLVAIATTPPPRFAFHADLQPPKGRTIEGSGNAVLMEVARLVDESSRK